MIVEGDQLSPAQWDELRAGEENPFGDDALQWRRKERFLALRMDGQLVSSAAWAIVDVQVAGEAFPVVGLGAVIVARPHRGKGYARAILEPWLERAATLGPEHASLFCSPENETLYTRFGFAPVGATVTADQPGGPVEMSGVFMWRPLREGATWPAGPVRILGLPF